MRAFFVPFAVLGLAAAVEGEQVQVDPALPSYQLTGTALAGEFNVVGAVASKKATELWTEAFSKLHPDVRFRLTLKGSSTAAAPLVTGISQLAPMGRELWDCELIQFKISWGYLPLRFRVSRGSYNIPHRSQVLAIYVNKDNPIEKLTLAQVDAIFSKTVRRGSKEGITTWGQLGVGADWARQTISAYGLGEDSTGVAEWVRTQVLLNGKWRDTVTELSSPQELIRRLSEDRFGIGFTGISYLAPGVKIVALAESDAGPYSAGSLADVLAGKYPLTRSTYMYLRKAPGKPMDVTLREFLMFVLSKEGQETVVKGGELLPLPIGVVLEERARLEKLN